MTEVTTNARVLGLGGVFIRSKDPAALAAWYQRHLGIAMNGYDGSQFAVLSPVAAPAYNVFSLFSSDSTYLGKAEQSCMLNFVVADVRALVAQLRAEGVSVEADIQDGEYGVFGWLSDPDGRRIELWQPPQVGP